jgi:hypothetical protein
MQNSKSIGKSYESVLPFDTRLIPDVFSFSHVKGVARIFLTIEIILSSLVVFGTLVLFIMTVFFGRP